MKKSFCYLVAFIAMLSIAGFAGDKDASLSPVPPTPYEGWVNSEHLIFGNIGDVGIQRKGGAYLMITNGSNSTSATGNLEVKNLKVLGANAANQDLGAFAVVGDCANAAATGTTVNTITKLTGVNTCVIAGTGDNKNGAVIGITVSGAGTTGNAQVAYAGQVPCVFDNAITQNDYVTVATGTVGNCHDSGSTQPFDGSTVLGRVFSPTNGSAGTYTVFLDPSLNSFTPVTPTFYDSSDATKTVTWQMSGASTSTKLTLAETLAANRTVTFTDPGGAANVAYTNSTTAQAMSGLGALTPLTAGSPALGSNSLPWLSIFLGTAGTNTQQILPTATAAARVTNLCDQGANGAICVGDQADPTKTFILDSHSATTAKALTLAHVLANSRTVTFPDGGGNTSVAYTNNNASTVQVMSTINSNTGNKVMLTSDFTDANASGLQVITGLAFTLPTSYSGNLAFHCSLLYSQGTAGASDQFGVAVLTTAPTRLDAGAQVSTNVTTTTYGNLANLTTSTPTAIVTFTDGVNTTILPAYLDGVVQLAGGGSQGLQFYVTNGTASNLIIVRAGSYCTIN